jgi:MSHA biogenesis protein MshQ
MNLRFLILILSLALSLISSLANAATYAYRNDSFSYDTPSVSASTVTWHATGASPACTTYPLGDDDWADISFPSGFKFTFGGVDYTNVRIYSNGILKFGSDASGYHRNYSNLALPITSNALAFTGCSQGIPTNIMLPYWTDIVAGTGNNTTGASVKYELITDPVTNQDRFVISWVNVKLYNTTTRYNFQVVLYESNTGVNGNFKYNYTTGSSTGSAATVGVQLSTTDSTQYSYNQAFIDTTNGTSILWYPANQLDPKTAEYRFDESTWTNTPNEVKDTSGNSQNASVIGLVTNTATGKLCRGGSFTNNTSNTTIDAIATPIVPGNTGSVDMWYKSNVAWNAGSSNATFFDATKIATQPFFFMKLANGRLRFAITDSAGTVLTAETSTSRSFAANTWHHVGVSWNIKPGSNQTVLQIFLDGDLETTNTTTPYRSTSSGNITNLSSIYIGDNRTSGITPNTGTPNGANGTIDEIYIYARDISATQAEADMNIVRTTCTSLDHFHIVHSGQVVGCNPANVVVEAHDAAHALFNLAGTTMQIATSKNHGTWSGISTINPVNDTGNGTANYTFSNESRITLGLTNGFIETLNINLASGQSGPGQITETSGAGVICVPSDYTFGSTCDSDLTFLEAGFLFDVLNHISEVSQTVTVSAVRKSNDSLTCTPAFASVNRNINFTCNYNNPATGSMPVRVGNKALNSGNSTTAACDSSGQNVNLSFNASGVATTTVQYADVGNMTLTAKITTGGLNMTGSDNFITAPAIFAFSGISTAPIKAGSNFGITVTAQNSANTTTPNFGKETTAEGASLSFNKCQPSGSNSVNGSFTGSLGSFTNGVATASTLKWTEVGNGDITATLTSGSYLGSGITASNNTGNSGTVCNGAGNVGRFIPDHFDTIVTQGCNAGNFSYSAQPFNVQVKAMNALGNITINYDGTANTSPNFSKTTTLSDANAIATGSLLNASVPLASFTQGIANATPNYTFTSALTSPATIKLRAADTDAVSSASGIIEGSTLIRSGRIRIQNAYGSELLDLPMPMVAQYWNNGSWALNSNDICTTGVSLAFTDPNVADGLVPSELCVLDTGNPGSSGLGCTASGIASKRFKLPPSNGNFNLTLRAPGAGNTGSIDVTATVPAWLKYNWTGAGNTNPSARATFGTYRAPIIYLREVF